MRTRYSLPAGDEPEETFNIPKELTIDGKDALRGEKVEKKQAQTYKWGGKSYEVTDETPEEWLKGKPKKEGEGKKWSLPNGSNSASASPVPVVAPSSSSSKKRSLEDGGEGNGGAVAKKARTVADVDGVSRSGQKVPRKATATASSVTSSQRGASSVNAPAKKSRLSTGSNTASSHQRSSEAAVPSSSSMVTPSSAKKRALEDSNNISKDPPAKKARLATNSSASPSQQLTSPQRGSISANTTGKTPLEQFKSGDMSRPQRKRNPDADDGEEDAIFITPRTSPSQGSPQTTNAPTVTKPNKTSGKTSPKSTANTQTQRRKTSPAEESSTAYFGISKRKPSASKRKASSKLPTPPAPDKTKQDSSTVPGVAASSSYANLFTENEVQGFARMIVKIAKLNGMIDKRKEETQKIAEDIQKIKARRATMLQLSHEQREAYAEAEEMATDSEDEEADAGQRIIIDQALTPSSSERTQTTIESNDAAVVGNATPARASPAPTRAPPTSAKLSPAQIKSLLPAVNRGGQELRWSPNIQMNLNDSNRAETAIFRERLSGESKSARRRRVQRERRTVAEVEAALAGAEAEAEQEIL